MDSVFESNLAVWSGAAISSVASTLTLQNVSFIAHSHSQPVVHALNSRLTVQGSSWTHGAGPVIHAADSQLALTACVVRDNDCSSASVQSVLSSIQTALLELMGSTADVVDCQITRNTGFSDSGSALLIGGGGTLRLFGTNFSSNSVAASILTCAVRNPTLFLLSSILDHPLTP